MFYGTYFDVAAARSLASYSAPRPYSLRTRCVLAAYSPRTRCVLAAYGMPHLAVRRPRARKSRKAAQVSADDSPAGIDSASEGDGTPCFKEGKDRFKPHPNGANGVSGESKEDATHCLPPQPTRQECNWGQEQTCVRHHL